MEKIKQNYIGKKVNPKEAGKEDMKEKKKTRIIRKVKEQ